MIFNLHYVEFYIPRGVSGTKVGVGRLKKWVGLPPRFRPTNGQFAEFTKFASSFYEYVHEYVIFECSE